MVIQIRTNCVLNIGNIVEICYNIETRVCWRNVWLETKAVQISNLPIQIHTNNTLSIRAKKVVKCTRGGRAGVPNVRLKFNSDRSKKTEELKRVDLHYCELTRSNPFEIDTPRCRSIRKPNEYPGALNYPPRRPHAGRGDGRDGAGN